MHESCQPLTTGDKVKILAVVGFLGAGKTTLLRRLLSCGADMLSDTVVIVNDFGEIGIDASLLVDQGSDVIELSSGCVCCTLSVDLTLTLQSILERFAPRRILLEASGVADPRGISVALGEIEVKKHVELYKTIAVLDADVWEMRGLFGQLFYLQLEMADLILLNKIDLLSKENIHGVLTQIHEVAPHAQVVPTSYCRIGPESIWDDGRRFGSGFSLSHDHGTDPIELGFVTFSFHHDAPLEERSFKGFIDQLPFEVFRVKGTVGFRDRTMLLNFVGGKAEWSVWHGSAGTRLAFVGWDVDGGGILRKLEACVLGETPPRPPSETLRS